MSSDNQSYERDPDAVFHERPHLLSKQAYRGFSIKHTNQHWEGVKITVANPKGIKLSASAETEHEALKKLIDQIDQFLDQ